MEGWSDPRPLIQSNGEHLVVNEETARLLADVRVPVVAVAIAGIYRTGKSYLMNRLANKMSGFPLGDTVQSKTKGIWAWCLPHPQLPGHSLLLLDTEGLSDPEKASEKEDIQLLSLAVLLSSFFVYNAIGKIDQEMINRLYFLSQVLDSISVKARTADESVTTDFHELQRFLPDFALIVRDFSLELIINNQTVSADEYFTSVLKLQEGPPEQTAKYNRPRQAVQQAFRSHGCFVLPRPVEDDELFCKLETLKESELSQTFLQQSAAFSQFVYSNAIAKKVSTTDAQAINGKVWVSLTREYVSAINSNAVPSIEATFTSVVQRTNNEAIEEAVQKYNQDMATVVFPLSVAEIQSANQKASDDAVNQFQQQALADAGGNYSATLKTRLSQAFAAFNTQNEQTSRAKCRQVLDALYHSIITPKINTYTSSQNGDQLYEADLIAMQNGYAATANKGCMDAVVLQEFLNERSGERSTIQQAVAQLIQREKEQQELQRQREAAELAAKMEQLRLEAERRKTEELQRQQEEERVRAAAEQQRLLEEQQRKQAEEERILLEQQRAQHEAQLAAMRASAAAAMPRKKKRKWYKF